VKKSKQFFFDKMNRKTFAILVRALPQRAHQVARAFAASFAQLTCLNASHAA
jgi:hypothetical protein